MSSAATATPTRASAPWIARPPTRELVDARATLRALRRAGDVVPRAQPRFPERVRATAGRARLHARLVAGAPQAGLVLRHALRERRASARVPATMAPSAVRLPAPVRNALARADARPGGVLLPPVGVRRHDAGADSARLPLPHRRAGAGVAAETIAWFRQRGATFRRMRELPLRLPPPRAEQRKRRRQHHQRRYQRAPWRR